MTERRIATIGAYLGTAGKVAGAERGAELLKRELVFDDRVADGGDIVSDADEGLYRGQRSLARVIDVTRRVKASALQALQEGRVPVVLGGDHSCAIGNIDAACEHFGNETTGVVYLDAHGDLNTPATSDTGNLHGMVLSASMGNVDEELGAIATQPLLPRNLMLIAQRNLDEGERELISREGIRLMTSADIVAAGADETLRAIRQFVADRGLRHLHFSIDIDAVDAASAPGTGVPEPEGLSPECFLSIVRAVCSMDILCSIDFVEFNPLLDQDGKTTRLCRQTVNILLGRE